MPAPAQSADSGTITITVTAVGHGNAPPQQFGKNDVTVRLGNKDRPVLSCEPTNSSEPKLDLVIVVDDALVPSTAGQWNDVKSFLANLPPGARVAIAYARRGAIEIAQQPTPDHALASAALRTPAGADMIEGSPYESLQSLIRGWPSRQGRREIVFISSGIDYYSGAFSAEATDWPSLEKAVDQAQLKGITIYSIFAKPTQLQGTYEANVALGQNALNHLSMATGGKAFYAGITIEPSFQPFLQEIQKDLERQYLLTFQAEPGPKAGFSDIRISPANKSLQIRYSSRVFVPAAK
jgi:hypothetical protein